MLKKHCKSIEKQTLKYPQIFQCFLDIKKCEIAVKYWYLYFNIDFQSSHIGHWKSIEKFPNSSRIYMIVVLVLGIKSTSKNLLCLLGSNKIEGRGKEQDVFQRGKILQKFIITHVRWGQQGYLEKFSRGKWPPCSYLAHHS